MDSMTAEELKKYLEAIINVTDWGKIEWVSALMIAIGSIGLRIWLHVNAKKTARRRNEEHVKEEQTRGKKENQELSDKAAAGEKATDSKLDELDQGAKKKRPPKPS